jgi:hypothetical protein
LVLHLGILSAQQIPENPTQGQAERNEHGSPAWGSKRCSIPPGFCQFRGINVMCGPRGLPGEGDHLFHNNGNGTFTDVSAKAGVSDPRGYYGLASVFVDVDDDGWVDLLVANDSVPKYLYRNKHDATFKDISYLSGFALNDERREQAAMGIAVGDYNRDGKVDFHIDIDERTYAGMGGRFRRLQ